MDLDPKSRQASFSFSPSSTAPAFGSSQQQDQRESNIWVFRDDIDLIEKTVEDFRSQRLSMVQSLRQFVLCYESVLEWWLGELQGPKSA
jgi:protein-tyrosine phosphatase